MALHALFNNVGYRTCKHLKAFGHLQSHHSRIVLPHMPNGFVDFERIVIREGLDCSIELEIIEDFRGYLISNSWAIGSFVGRRR